MKSLLCAVGLLVYLLSASLQASTVTDIYRPNHKLAAELIQTLQPIYQQQARLATEGQQIIIRGEQTVVDQIQELLLQLDHPPRVFRLEISNTVEQANVTTYATQSRSLNRNSFTITENAPLVLVEERLGQQLNAVGPWWVSVERLPVDKEALTVTLQAAQDTVYVDLALQTLSNGLQRVSSQQISGPLDQWLPVGTATAAADDSNRTTWSTQRSSIQALFIKVVPAH